jgi:hypothetical protein
VGDKGLRLWLFALTLLWALNFIAVVALPRVILCWRRTSKGSTVARDF